jgi:hypothetical protein
MAKLKRKYVKVNGEIRIYEYERLSYQRRNKRLRCPLKSLGRGECKNMLRKISYRMNGEYICVGYYCSKCDTIFLTENKKMFKVTVE